MNIQLSSFLIHSTIITIISAARPWGYAQLFPSYNIPTGTQDPMRKVVSERIVKYHNFFRTKVRPTAANMLKMTWNQLAAIQAQEYADRCTFLEHNQGLERTVPALGECGQNIFVSSDKTPWFFAIKSWFLEYKNFTYGNENFNVKEIGHYTQMVWATSHQVGCGLAYCQGGLWGRFYNYICHYCPTGNYEIEYPYRIGKPCDDCPDHCSDKLCTNSCPVTDLYSNCNELVMDYAPKICPQGVCNATCTCGNVKIHKNYPW